MNRGGGAPGETAPGHAFSSAGSNGSGFGAFDARADQFASVTAGDTAEADLSRQFDPPYSALATADSLAGSRGVAAYSVAEVGGGSGETQSGFASRREAAANERAHLPDDYRPRGALNGGLPLVVVLDAGVRVCPRGYRLVGVPDDWVAPDVRNWRTATGDASGGVEITIADG